MKKLLSVGFLLGLLIVLSLQMCTKIEEIYTCGDRNGDGIENELDCIGRDGKDGVDGKDGANGMPYEILMNQRPSTVCDGYVMSFYADVNGNKTIDDEDRLIGEIPVCNGQDGSDGTDGSDGESPTFVLTNTDASDKCPNGGVLVEIFVNNISQGSFEVCNGADGEDFVYNHSYEITNDPVDCAEAGGRTIKIYNADNELVEEVILCFGMTYGVLKEKVLPLRKYFEDVSVIYKEITTCDNGNGFEVWVSIDDAEILHFYICPPPTN